jgi:hypothetical protein
MSTDELLLLQYTARGTTVHTSGTLTTLFHTKPTTDIFTNSHLLSIPYVRTKPVSLRHVAFLASFEKFSICIF